MKLTTTTTDIIATRRVALGDPRPVIRLGMFGGGREVQIDSVAITYAFIDGEWTVRHPADVSLVGSNFLKDGTLSPLRSVQGAPHGWEAADETAWLMRLVDLLRPGTDLTLTVYRDHEVGE